MALPKGKSGNPNGKPKGVQNKATVEFKEAVNNLLTHATPKMIEWLERIAIEDPYKAMSIMDKFAEFAHAKLSRITLDGDPNNPLQLKHITHTDNSIIESALEERVKNEHI